MTEIDDKLKALYLIGEIDSGVLLAFKNRSTLRAFKNRREDPTFLPITLLRGVRGDCAPEWNATIKALVSIRALVPADTKAHDGSTVYLITNQGGKALRRLRL